MEKEFRTKAINVKFTAISAVFCFRIFPCRAEFHDSRDHFAMVKDTSFKNVSFHKLGLKFVSKRSIQLGLFEFLKVGSVFEAENAKVSENRTILGLLVVRLKSLSSFKASIKIGYATF